MPSVSRFDPRRPTRDELLRISRLPSESRAAATRRLP